MTEIEQLRQRIACLENVLNDLCNTVEATGGIVDDGVNRELAADPEWVDLLHTYEDACFVLGRKPEVDDISDG